MIDMLGLDEVTASVQAPPPSSHLRAAVGVTVPSFLSRNTLSIGLQVRRRDHQSSVSFCS